MAELKVYADIHEGRGRSKIKVDFKFSPDLVAAIKEVPGASFTPRDKGGPYWTVPLDLDSAKLLRNVFGDGLRVSKDLKEWGWKIVKQANKLSELSAAEDADLEELHNQAPDLADSLRPFQRAAVRFGTVADNPLIADQPGLGKTREAIGAILESKLPGPYLVVAPKASLETVWGDHLRNVLDRDDSVYVVSEDGREKNLAVLHQAAKEVEDGARVWLITNPEKLRFVKQCPVCEEPAPILKTHLKSKHEMSDKDEEGKKELSELMSDVNRIPQFPVFHDIHWSAIVIDECHKGAIRNPNTATAKALYKLKADKRIALSGTPMKNRPIDLWGTLHWLNPEVFTSKWRWANRFLHVYHNGYGNVFCSGRTPGGIKCGQCEGGIRHETLEAFNEHLTPYLLRRTKAEVFPELPPKQHVDIWCDMDPAQAKQYEEFADLAEIKIRDETISATNVLAELTRLKQFAISTQDVRYNDDDTFQLTPNIDHSGKLEALEMLLDERGIIDNEATEKVVIFSQFREVVDAVYRWLEDQDVQALRITGKVKSKDRDEAQRVFQSDGGPAVMLMTTTAGGVAITLDQADSVIFLDETWSPADMEQAEDRVHRVSRIHHVTVYTLRTKETVDDYIMSIVREKGSIQQLVMDDRRNIKLKS